LLQPFLERELMKYVIAVLLALGCACEGEPGPTASGWTRSTMGGHARDAHPSDRQDDDAGARPVGDAGARPVGDAGRRTDTVRETGPHASHHDGAAAEVPAEDDETLTSDGHAPPAQGPTFDDVAPLFAQHCVSCHRADGAGPFRLDQYADAKRHGAAAVAATRAGTMPPWHITSDGTCGDFADIKRLSAAELELLARWVDEGARPGTRDVIDLPPTATLGGARVYSTPAYTPTTIGPPLAAQDDYRCFLIEPELVGEQFITAYEIRPEQTHLVHHAIAYVIDPQAPSRIPGVDNAALIDVLDATSPDVPGWTCLVEAGDGVTIRATPATWLPGQPPMALPNDSGVRVQPSYKYVLQVHYNLGHSEAASEASKVDLHFQYADTVKNEGIFVTGDGLLATVTELAPVALADGKPSEVFRWQRTMAEMGLKSPRAELWAVYPHMHELGHKYRMTLQRPGEREHCAADVQAWDFHWQRMYAYRTPLEVTPDMLLDVTCDYDTTSRTEPVLPGASTSNEMCSAIMYLTTPLANR
jgi:mono/diheme cytochrome c family protein